MGYPGYSQSDATFRRASFINMHTDDLFEQNRRGHAHESMVPSVKENKANLRESRDSELHPNSVPVIIELDITGSMGDIPNHLIRIGLPKMIGRMQELGIKDPQILIMACGDSQWDGNNGVFQLGQFESGDKEIDMWLQRVWISKKGGGNGGESYGWAYYYALNHVETDAWDKRKQKGFLFSIGDDNCHPTMFKNEMDDVMGYLSKGEAVEIKHIAEKLKEKWNIYHIDLGGCMESWKRLIGSECVICDIGRTDYEGMGEKIAQTVASGFNFPSSAVSGVTNAESFNQQIMSRPDQSTNKITL